uniref:L1 transposable element RRM domain-containing protein n=1 Tax=Equus caballus TaxID=9796 RepID=A0A9L0SCP5_HORSE
MLDMKIKINEIKKNLESLNNRADITEDTISNLEDRNIEILQMEEEKELRLKRKEKTLQEISDSIRKCNTSIIGISEGEGREKRTESLFKEIIAENFPNLGKELELQVNEVNRAPNYINVKRPPRHIVVKLAKVDDKEKTLRQQGRRK